MSVRAPLDLALWAMFVLGFLGGLWWRSWCDARRERDDTEWALREFTARLNERRN